VSATVRVRALQAASVLALLGVWEAVVRLGLVDPLFVPAPSAVIRGFGAIAPTAMSALGDTLLKTAIAYVLAAVLGVTGGIVIGSVRSLHDTLHPFVGTAPAIAYGTIHGLFPILVLVMGAVRDVDRTLLTVARSYGARPWQVYVKVILPAIVPSVLASLRLGIVFCLLGVLIVEMFAGVRGMGSVMGGLANGFRAPELFAATGLVSVASIAIVLGLDHLNEKLSRWRG